MNLTLCHRPKPFTFTLIMAALLSSACAEQPPGNSPCNSPKQIALAESLLVRDPLGAIGALEGVSDCDDKFALMYGADAEIAHRAQDDYYYQGKVRPRGRYDRDASAFKYHVDGLLI